MRRIISAALVVATALLVLLVPAGAGAAKKKHHAAPAAIKLGTYKAKAGEASFAIVLKKAKCAAPGQSATATHLCVSLPESPEVQCTGAVPTGGKLGSFSNPVALSLAGAATQQATISAPPSLPGGPPTPGTSAFSVSFTKKGTATGYVELNLTITFGTATVPCASGKVPFTAKLG
jgi:hypothetical protein